jgi:gliding motility-associated protein GldM
LEDRYNNLYAIFGDEQTEGIKKAQEKAKKLQDLTKDMVKYIETIRWEMTIDVDGENASGVQEAQKAAKNGEVPCVPVSQIEGKENVDKPTAFMIGSSDKPDPDKYAVKLKKKLTDYHASLLKFIENEEGKRHPQIEEMLSRLKPADMVYSAHKKKEVPWEIYNFSHLNTGSQVILLNKMISEVKYAEGVVLNYIIASAGAANLAFAEYAGYSMADSRVLFPGDSYKTTVVVAAFDPMQKLDVYYQIGVDYLSEDNEGSANHVDGPATGVNIELPAGGTGQHKIAGYIKVRNENTGKVECYHFKDEYVVIPKQVMY